MEDMAWWWNCFPSQFHLLNHEFGQATITIDNHHFNYTVHKLLLTFFFVGVRNVFNDLKHYNSRINDAIELDNTFSNIVDRITTSPVDYVKYYKPIFVASEVNVIIETIDSFAYSVLCITSLVIKDFNIQFYWLKVVVNGFDKNVH